MVFGVVIRVVDVRAKQPLANFILQSAYAPFFAVRSWAFELAALRAENARLRQALAEARVRAQRGVQYAREAEKLRALRDRPPGPNADRPIQIARIVGWQNRSGREEVIVDRGRQHQITLFSPAITERGVVGKVREVMRKFARVQLLTDPACRVAVRDVRSEVLGVVRTDEDRLMYMDHVAVEADVKAGDTLVTAGHGGIFPAGLLVGTVTRVERVETSLLLRVEVELAAEFDKLDFLIFLEPEVEPPPGAPYEVEGSRP
jgi:rod shape-determining protein MreC